MYLWCNINLPIRPVGFSSRLSLLPSPELALWPEAFPRFPLLCRSPGHNISPALCSYTWNTREWGVVYLYTNIEERACDLAVYIIENRATVRSAATQFGISKSTVHKDLTERLPRLDPALYKQVRQLLDLNKAERHIRGGLATRRKYKGE